MRLLFLDDARQRTCSREKMGSLIAVGGISISEECIRPLEESLEALCSRFGFPQGEVFKWSPGRDHWMRENLIGESREAFLLEMLGIVAGFGVTAHVAICDASRSKATKEAPDHEIDALLLVMERFDGSLGKDEPALVIVARPSGGRSDEDKFLDRCAEVIAKGTSYTKFSSISMNILTMPFHNSRIMQAADVIASVTTAMVAGHERYANAPFQLIRSLFKESYGRQGGVGLKIHPDYVYANLYHWLLGDKFLIQGSVGVPLPIRDRPYAVDGERFR